MKNVPLANAKQFTDIPGVGPSIANDLRSLGYENPADLRGEDPEAMYERLVVRAGAHIDRCVLYVFRCAVYYAQTPDPDPDKLQWWNWKDNPEQRSKTI